MPKIERTKKDDRMLKTLIEDFERGELRTDHPLQRNPGRWNTDYRDGEIATIIKGEDIDPIKICEQIDVDEESCKKIIENWLIDGIQRLTYPMKYMLGAFRLGNNIEFPIVTFLRARKDVDGSFVMENGRRIYDEIEFDLRGKAFKDLPPELQSNFESYSFSIVKQLDCTNEEVGYHIRRYNKQSNMNGSEKTITYLDTIAKTIKEISAHKFFKDNCTKISQNEKIKGAVNKIVIETLMILNYFEDWTKDNKKQGLYLEEKATENDFNGMKAILDRLANIVTKENEVLFTSKNTFIWIKMFDYFTNNFNLPDEKFSEFLDTFIDKLREKDCELATPMKIYGEETDHCTYKALDESKSTKDKYVVSNKLHILETLMNEYFSNDSVVDSAENNEVEESKVDEIQTEEFEKKVEETFDDSEMETLDFVRKYVNPEITEDDIDDYFDDINTYVKSKIIDKDSEVISSDNENAIIALIAYTYKHDISMDAWLQRYAISHKTLPKDMSQKERFDAMLHSLYLFTKTQKKLQA
jgi:hypothetical protein